MTLALLITAVTGAWADEVTVTFTQADLNGSMTVAKDGVTLTPGNDDARSGANLYDSGSNTFSVDKGTFTKIEIVNCTDGDIDGWQKEQADRYRPNPVDYPNTWVDLYTLTWTGEAESVTFTANVYGIQSIVFTIEVTDVEVTTNAASAQDLFTEAKFNMPAFDATVNYELVRDMQDATNPVAFTGLPTNDEPIVVKKGSDGKYQPAKALTIQLIDPLAAAEAQNIIGADGITVKVLVGDGGTPIEYDQVPPITLKAFLADMQPGYYRITAEPTDENSSYDGIVYSSEFTVVEQYDLTVKPANDFSKGKIESVTVGPETVTPDATTGEATKTGITPDTEVKLKAKRGYVIEKVEAKKDAEKTITIGEQNYTVQKGETWKQFITRNQLSGWSVKPHTDTTWRVRKDNPSYTLLVSSDGINWEPLELTSEDAPIDTDKQYTLGLVN